MKAIFGVIIIAALCSCAVPDARDHASHMIVVRGEVQSPGYYQRLDGMTIRQAIQSAGGYTRFASGIRVERDGKRVLHKRDREWRQHADEWDLQLKDDDIVVAERMYE